MPPQKVPVTRTQYYTASSLDGFIADASNSLDWLLQFGDPEGGDYSDFIRGVGALAMGSTTYEWILTNHVRAGSSAPQPWPYTQPTWVFSSRDLPDVEGADIRHVRGDVRPVHRAMVREAAGKNIWLVGGGELVGQFYDHGLLDELFVSVAPVVLGSGAPLLPRTIATPPLRLLSVQEWGGGFVALHYQVQRPLE
ncbi:MAG: dihydrofolate reductase family protein [Anaerolineae bacterium]